MHAHSLRSLEDLGKERFQGDMSKGGAEEAIGSHTRYCAYFLTLEQATSVRSR